MWEAAGVSQPAPRVWSQEMSLVVAHGWRGALAGLFSCVSDQGCCAFWGEEEMGQLSWKKKIRCSSQTLWLLKRSQSTSRTLLSCEGFDELNLYVSLGKNHFLREVMSANINSHAQTILSLDFRDISSAELETSEPAVLSEAATIQVQPAADRNGHCWWDDFGFRCRKGKICFQKAGNIPGLSGNLVYAAFLEEETSFQG